MFRKKGVLDRKQKETWSKNHRAVYEAIRKIEKKLVPPTLSKIKDQLKEDEINLSEKSIITHLKKAVEKEELEKIGRVYSSKMKIIADTLYQTAIFSEVASDVPRLEGEKFDEFLSRSFSITDKLIQEYEKKSNIPIIGWLYYKPKLDNLLASKRSMKPSVRSWVRNDFDFIEKAAEIKVLSSKKLPFLNIYKIRETFAQVLYYMLGRERALADAKEQKFSLDDFGLTIVMNFDPKKVGEPPTRPTLKELIEEIEKIERMPAEDLEIFGFDKEYRTRLKRIKLLLEKRRNDLRKEVEEVI